MSAKTSATKFLYFARDLRSRRMYGAIRRYCRGAVLDVGGWDFYRTAIRKRIPFDSWVILDLAGRQPSESTGRRVAFVSGDGCNMGFAAGSFDTVLNIQVLEHVLQPIEMMNEMSRVLREDGHMVLLVPQTSTLHMAPHHYYNFTRFWIQEALRRAGLQILELRPLGGVWSSMASHLFFFFLQSIRFEGMSTRENGRNLFFYVLCPFMALFAVIAIPICLLFSLGDLSEEPNNYLVVARKTTDPSLR